MNSDIHVKESRKLYFLPHLCSSRYQPLFHQLRHADQWCCTNHGQTHFNQIINQFQNYGSTINPFIKTECPHFYLVQKLMEFFDYVKRDKLSPTLKT